MNILSFDEWKAAKDGSGLHASPNIVKTEGIKTFDEWLEDPTPLHEKSFQAEVERQMEENWKAQNNNKSLEDLKGELRSLQKERDRNTQMWDETGNYLGENEVLKADYDRKIGEVRNKISSFDRKPKTNARRDELIERLGELERYSGVVTTTEMADQWNREQRAIREELADIDRELENPERFYDTQSRAPAVVRGSLKQAGSEIANAGATALNAMDELLKKYPELMSYTTAGLTGGPADAVIAAQALEFDKAHKKDIERFANGESKDALKESYDKVYDFADRWQDEASHDLQKAKEGLSWAGQAGIDIATNMIQMGIDAAGKYAGLGMVPFFLRAAGGAAQEARREMEYAQQQENMLAEAEGRAPKQLINDDAIWKQLGYGLTAGTIELATEKLFDGVAGLFGKGMADDVVENLVGRLSSSNTGRTVLRAIAGAAGEGAEEVISDLLNPLAERIYNDNALKELIENGFDWSEMAYDFMIGAAVGGMGSVGSIVSGENAYKNAMLDYKMIADAYNNASKTSAFSKNTTHTDNFEAEMAETEKNSAGAANYGEKNTAPDGTEGTYINTDPAIHTAEEQETIDNYVKAVDDKIKNFISKVRTLTNPKYRSSVRLEISDVNPVLTEKIKELTGVNTTGFKNIITGGTIDHIIKRHGKSGYADNSMRYENDIARIPYVLENFDGAYQLRNKDGSPSVSDVWKNSDGTGAKRVVLWKKLDGTYYIAQAAPDSKAHVLAIESAFIGSEKNIKKESTDEVLNMPVSVPQVTPETPHHANAFLDTNISYEQRKSNENRFQSGQEGENYNKKAAEPLGEPAYGSHGEMDAHRDEANAATIDSAQAIGISKGNYEQEENYERAEADYRGQERRLPDSTGTENGVMGKGSGRGTKAAEQIRAAGERQNRGRNLPQISSRELGLDGGTDRYNLKLIPSQLWDNELKDTAEKIRRESGREVSFVLGQIEVQGSTGKRYTRGIITDSKIIVQADHKRLSVAQIAEHELYHAAAEATPGTNWYCEQKIKEKYGEEEFNKVVEKYIEKLRGIIDIPDNGTEAEIEEALNAIKEEIFADAYAGINAFGAHAEKYLNEVRSTVEERSGKGRAQEAPETRGPPKYSLDDTEIPTYEQLIAKPDIKIVDLGNGFEGSFREKRKKIINTTQYSKPHWNKDTGALMFLSKNTLTHSFNNIGTEQLIAAEKLPEIIENAVLTHREPDKHGNETVSGVYTFFGAVRFNGETLPVKLKVKEYKTLNNMLPENVADYFEQHGKQDRYSKVYDSKVLSIEKVEIKIEPNGSEKRNQQNAESYLPPLGSVVSIRDLLSLVKGDAEKYIPKPASKLTSRGPSRKASVEDWEEAEKMRFMGLTDKKINELTGLVREENEWYYPEKKHSEKYSLDDTEIPTYEQLIAKPDVHIVNIDTKVSGTAKERRNSVNRRELISKPYRNNDTGALIFLSDKTFTHTFSNRGLEQIAAAGKLPEIIENAVLTHREPDKHNRAEVRGSYTFFGAVRYGDDVRPVKLKVLEYDVTEKELPENVIKYFGSKLTEHYSKLYDSKVLEIEKIDIKKEPDGSKQGKMTVDKIGDSLPPSGSTISIKDLINLVKGDAIKYIPKPASNLTKRGKSRKASMEDWEKAEKMRFMGLTDKEISELTGLVREGNEWYYPEKKHAEKYSVEDEEYSYEWFVSKPDMKLTEVQEHEGLSRAEIVAEAKKNAAAVGYINSNGVPTVHVTDIDTDIEVPVTAIRHGLDRRLAKQAPVTMQIGEVLQNAIKINELEPRKDSISNSYVLVGAAKGSKGTYITEFVVNRRTNEIEDIDVLYSANTKENANGNINKKEPAAFLPEFTDESASLTGSTISIAELLRLVNRYFPDIMPKNVLAHFEHAERPKGILGESAKYSVEDEAPAPYSEERSKNFRAYMEQKQGGLFTEQQARAERARRARAERDAVLQERNRENIERAKQLKEEAKKRGETNPWLAKKELRQNLYKLFETPYEKREEVGQIIDSFAENVMKKRKITEKDRKEFFDRLYEEGVITIPLENDNGKGIVKGGRIYVDDSIKADFGDDWKAFYRRAFAAGIRLTTKDRSIPSVEQWTKELGESLPGLFDSEELDGKIALERIVQVAEEGQGEKMSLADYTAMIADEKSVSESFLLDEMEKKLDVEIENFAVKSKFEIKLRDKDVWKNAKEKAERREMLERRKERKILSEYQKKVQRELQWLSKNRRTAPEEQKAKIDDILGDLDILAIGAANELQWNKRYDATWGDLAEMYETAKANDPNFIPSDDLEKIYSRINKPKVADLTISDLYDKLNAAVGLRHELETRNKELGEERKKQFSQLYNESKEEIQGADGGYKTNKFKHFGDKVLNLKQLSAMNVIQRMVGWNPDSTFYKATAKQLEEGERNERAYITKAEKMMGKFLKENEEWVKKADGQGDDAIWYELSVPPLFEYGQGHKPVFDKPIKVYMTPSQKVHLYLESKNYDNLRHMEGGRTFVNKELYSQGKRQEAFAQGTTIRLAPETVKRILKDNPLTEEEMKLANVLQEYYNVTAKNEINKVSNILNGYDKAVHENYAPIYTNKNYTNQEFGVFDVSAEGVGNMKERQKSQNPSYNISCFEAFEKHTEQTARYVGMAIPTRNLTKLLNWQEDGHSMREVIGKKWGDEGLKYIDDLITSLQSGNSSKGTETGILEKIESNFISSIFGTNPSIVAKQLGSIPMGSVYLGFENLKGIDVRHIDRELIAKYTQELDYRTLGYSTPETKFLKENPNWTETNKVTSFVFGGGAITAMDGWAASVLWPQAENKVKHEHPELEIGTQEMIDAGQSPFYKKVAEEFNEAVARSQSTSDQMHQGEFRKSKNPLTKAFTMFKSDSAQSYNAIRQKAGELGYYKKRLEELKQTDASPDEIAECEENIKKSGTAVGTAAVALLTNTAWAQFVTFGAALIKNAAKYYRDDDDELTFKSVFGEFASGVVGDLAGTLVGGEELAELIGEIYSGKSLRDWEISTMALEQFNDMCRGIAEGVAKAGGRTADVWNVLKSGKGIKEKFLNVHEYYSRHGNDILGEVKDLAETAATYFYGVPAKNFEKYLLGLIRPFVPQAAEAYNNLFETPDKNSLKGLRGRAAETEVRAIIKNRLHSNNKETAKELTRLYSSGFTVAIPSDTPAQFVVNGENHELNAAQQQKFDRTWKTTIGENLDDLLQSTAYEKANDETKAKMISCLYDYGQEKAKAEILEDYAVEVRTRNADSVIESGASLAEWAIWYGTSSGLKNDSEKIKALANTKFKDKTKLAMLGTIKGNAVKNDSGKLTSYGMVKSAVESGLKVNEALELMEANTLDDYLKWVDAGMSSKNAVITAEALDDLGPDAKEVEKYTEISELPYSEEIKEDALKRIMNEAAYEKYMEARQAGISTYDYCEYLRKISNAKSDVDRNGKTIRNSKKKKVLTIIDEMNVSDEQKDLLFLSNGYSKNTLNDAPWH